MVRVNEMWLRGGERGEMARLWLYTVSRIAEVYIERSAIITKGEKGREMWLIFLVFLSKTSRLLDL